MAARSACRFSTNSPMKKGAVSGIDGHIYFRPDERTTEKAVVSVKGDDHVSVPMLCDLGHVIDREKAKIGMCIR